MFSHMVYSEGGLRSCGVMTFAVNSVLVKEQKVFLLLTLESFTDSQRITEQTPSATTLPQGLLCGSVSLQVALSLSSPLLESR